MALQFDPELLRTIANLPNDQAANAAKMQEAAQRAQLAPLQLQNLQQQTQEGQLNIQNAQAAQARAQLDQQHGQMIAQIFHETQTPDGQIDYDKAVPKILTIPNLNPASAKAYTDILSTERQGQASKATIAGEQAKTASENFSLSEKQQAKATKDAAYADWLDQNKLPKNGLNEQKFTRIYENAAAPPLKLSPGDTVAPPGTGQDATFTAPVKPKFEQKVGTLNGKPVTANYDPATGKVTDASGVDITAAFQPKEAQPSEFEATLADFSKHPELVAQFGSGPIGFDKYKAGQKLEQAAAGRTQVLNSLLPPEGETANPVAKAIAEYRLPPISPRSMATPAGAELMKQVMAANPEYDGTQFPNRSATRKAFTTGTQGQQINAMNTVIGHMDQMTSAIDALNHGNFTPGNAAYDWVRTTFGSSAVTNFDNIKGAVAGELGKVLKGVVTEGEIARVEKNIRDSGSPDQLRGAIDTNIPIIGSKLAALDYQYHQAMGAKDPFSALSPDSEAVLTKHGFDPAHPTLGKGATGGARANPLSVTTTDGMVHTFKDAASADGFTKAARAAGLLK